MVASPVVVIVAATCASSVVVLIFVLVLVLFLRRRRRKSNQVLPIPQTSDRPLASLDRHKKDPSDASRLLPLLTPSEMSHEIFIPEATHVLTEQPNYFQNTYSDTTGIPQALQPTTLSLPITTQVPSHESNTNSPSIRLLPPVPQPDPSELNFQLSRHLPSLIIPSTPFSDTPLASSVRLTPGPGSMTWCNPTVQNDSSSSDYSIWSNPDDGHDDQTSSLPIISPRPQSHEQLDAVRIGHLLQIRAKSSRRGLSRSSTQSSLLLGRQNSIMSVLSAVDVAEDPREAVDTEHDDSQKSGTNSDPVAGPSNSANIARGHTAVRSGTPNHKRSRSLLRIKGRLLPPLPSSVPPPEQQHHQEPPLPELNATQSSSSLNPVLPASSSTTYRPAPDESRPHTAPTPTGMTSTSADRRNTSAGYPETQTPRSTRPPLPPLPTASPSSMPASRAWRALPPIVHSQPTIPA